MVIYGEKVVLLFMLVGMIMVLCEWLKDDNVLGMVFFDECIYIVEFDGCWLVVWYLVYKVFIEVGVKFCGEDVFMYLCDD